MFECHIQGLGACILTGHPHRPENSFFHFALEQLRGRHVFHKESSRGVDRPILNDEGAVADFC